ncbi:hypothetical protein HMPREF3213_01954 [Heyndrickxia coagulans]|uniref:Uncharacterized protein n=1 Tax=Heyndrickxia coagulans TaxID=1398 RepID=A0A133KQ64_HEYCO|nr:hypothetical protein HMPREF3213_01954 [Heyndrickxia coagulans]
MYQEWHAGISSHVVMNAATRRMENELLLHCQDPGSLISLRQSAGKIVWAGCRKLPYIFCAF